MEQPTNPSILEILKPQAISIGEIIKINETSTPGVGLYKTDENNFYKFLTVIYQNSEFSSIDGSISACVGGLIRSPRINSELKQIGVNTAKAFEDEQPVNGISLRALSKLISETGSVNRDGSLIIDGFDGPINNLFLSIDTQKQEGFEVFALIRKLYDKFGKNSQRVNLNIVIIDSKEEVLTKRAKQFEREVLNA